MINFEFTIIGAGPAAICALPALISRGINPKKILWIDAGNFNVGAFGTTLSAGSSLPGNTTVESYQKVNEAIYKIFPDCKPSKLFLMDTLPLLNTCPLNIAAEPMQHISDYLKHKVQTIHGLVTDVITVNEGFKIIIKLAQSNIIKEISSKKCILAIGATPKTINLPNKHRQINMIEDPNIIFIKSRLQEYLSQHPNITSFSVIGSSHSAALATMNLLNAGIKVKQFMNKTYKFAEPCLSPEGIKYTKHDNTGLKGEVALFTEKLLHNKNNNYELFIGANQKETDDLIAHNLSENTHVLATIGYCTAPTLKINNQFLDQFKFNHQTTEFFDIKNLFGLGIAYPLQTTAPDGEVEFSVGYGKFWNTVNRPDVIKTWELDQTIASCKTSS